MADISTVYSGDPDQDSAYPILIMISQNGTLRKLRMDNDGNLYTDPA